MKIIQARAGSMKAQLKSHNGYSFSIQLEFRLIEPLIQFVLFFTAVLILGACLGLLVLMGGDMPGVDKPMPWLSVVFLVLMLGLIGRNCLSLGNFLWESRVKRKTILLTDKAVVLNGHSFEYEKYLVGPGGKHLFLFLFQANAEVPGFSLPALSLFTHKSKHWILPMGLVKNRQEVFKCLD